MITIDVICMCRCSRWHPEVIELFTRELPLKDKYYNVDDDVDDVDDVDNKDVDDDDDVDDADADDFCSES
jgi:hypothetical protein